MTEIQFIDLQKEVYELKTKLIVSVGIIDEQAEKILKLNEEICLLMSSGNRDELWRQTKDRLQRLEMELMLSLASERKAAEHNRILTEKLLARRSEGE